MTYNANIIVRVLQASPSYAPRILPVTQFGHRLLCCSDCRILDVHLALQDLCPEARLQCGWQPGECEATDQNINSDKFQHVSL